MRVSKRPFRLIAGTLLPSALVAVCILLFLFFLTLMDTGEKNGESLLILLAFVLIPFAITALYSLLYSFLMEFVINPYVKNDVLAVLCSILLGIALPAGAITWANSIFFGSVLGLLMGLFLRRNYTQAMHNQSDNQEVKPE